MIHEDIRRAHTLPAAFYRDPAVLDRLRERVFARSWQLIDGAERAPEPGSVLPFALLDGCVDEPLLLARGRFEKVERNRNVVVDGVESLGPLAREVAGLAEIRSSLPAAHHFGHR